MAERDVLLYYGDLLNRYGFNEDHPFNTDRQEAFLREARSKELLEKVARGEPQSGSAEQVRLFHNNEYIRFVTEKSETGSGFLDFGDTPAVSGIYEGALAVIGTAIAAVDAVMNEGPERLLSLLPAFIMRHRIRPVDFVYSTTAV